VIKRISVVLVLLATIGLNSAGGAPRDERPAAAAKKAAGKTLGEAWVYLRKRAEQFHADLPTPESLSMEDIAVYEEHKNFVCVVGKTRLGMRQIHRKMILLKPSVMVLDDCDVDMPARVPPLKRGLLGHSTHSIKSASFSMGSNSPTVRMSLISFRFDTGRAVTVVGLPGKNAPTVKSGSRDKQFVLNITDDSGAWKLILPTGPRAAGSIAVADAKGKAILPERLLSSGIMPHGPKGVKMLAGWDSRYTRKNAAPWDTKKVAVELKKAVESGTIKPGRAIVLGCGAGTNSIYLASKGFDVTAIDIAPTALDIAKQRAAKAKVKVNWMLADVTAVPKLKPFDFMYDRGCYHGVRRSFAKEFVESAKKLSRPGTKFLILAGNANEARHYGPPRVKEEDIRNDFKALFDFTWLRESKFGPNGEKGKGPLMWSILMTRKSK
jgi:SAM-dependent methyltransferase